MNSRRVLPTVVCAILAYSMGSTAVLGQIAPKAESPPTDNGGGSPPLFSETTVDRPPDAGCRDLGCRASCCCPRWTASADFIILDRVGSFNRTLVETVPASQSPRDPGTEVLNATDLHQGFSGGPRLGLIHRGDNDDDLEFSYFQIDGWNAARSVGPYGFQVGAEGKLLERGRFSIGGMGKAGLFVDHAEETTTVSVYRILFGESDWTNRAAFVGETGVQCTYQVTQRLSLRAGYEAIWLRGVALAPGQIPDTSIHSSLDLPSIYVQPTGVNCGSGVFYHGATVGLEYSF